MAEVSHFSTGGPALFNAPLNCCLFPDGTLRVQTAEACASAKGSTVGGSERCALVCCQDPQGELRATEQHRCAQAGDAVLAAKDPHQCEAVCCTDTGSPAHTTREQCLGEAHPAVQCDPICCRRNGGSAFGVTRLECEQLEGVVDPATPFADCEQICCGTPQDGYALLTRADCLGLGRQDVGPQAVCSRKCCTVAGQERLLTRYECQQQGGTLDEDQDPDLCDQVCCLGPDQVTPTLEPRRACRDPGEQAADVGRCRTGCCRQRDGSSEFLMAWTCDLYGGTPELDSLVCDEVCCPPNPNRCLDAICEDGSCATARKPGAQCATADDCPEGQVCQPESCTCAPGNCGDQICELPGETDANCPEDCGCQALRGREPLAEFCDSQAYPHTRVPAPAGCWCDLACGWRDLGCCLDWADLCQPVCGDGRCDEWLSAETACTCPADCADRTITGPCPDLSHCGDHVCDPALGERPETCGRDCGCWRDVYRVLEVHPDWVYDQALSQACLDYPQCHPVTGIPNGQMCVGRTPPDWHDNGTCDCQADETVDNSPDCHPPAPDGVCDVCASENFLFYIQQRGTTYANPAEGSFYECTPWMCGDGYCMMGMEGPDSCPWDCQHGMQVSFRSGPDPNDP